MRYSASKNSVSLKTGLGVVQGHLKRRRSIDHILLLRHYKYSSILCRFWVIWRWIISLPWNLGLRSFKVIQTGTIRKLGCGFLFPFHSNICEIKRDIGQKSWFFIPPLHLTPSPRQSTAIPFGIKKLEWWGYPMVKKLWGYVQSFRHNTGVWRTVGQTDRHLATA